MPDRHPILVKRTFSEESVQDHSERISVEQAFENMQALLETNHYRVFILGRKRIGLIFNPDRHTYATALFTGETDVMSSLYALAEQFSTEQQLAEAASKAQQNV